MADLEQHDPPRERYDPARQSQLLMVYGWLGVLGVIGCALVVIAVLLPPAKMWAIFALFLVVAFALGGYWMNRAREERRRRS